MWPPVHVLPRFTQFYIRDWSLTSGKGGGEATKWEVGGGGGGRGGGKMKVLAMLKAEKV